MTGEKVGQWNFDEMGKMTDETARKAKTAAKAGSSDDPQPLFQPNGCDAADLQRLHTVDEIH